MGAWTRRWGWSSQLPGTHWAWGHWDVGEVWMTDDRQIAWWTHHRGLQAGPLGQCPFAEMQTSGGWYSEAVNSRGKREFPLWNWDVQSCLGGLPSPKGLLESTRATLCPAPFSFDSTYEWYHMVIVFLCLTYFTQCDNIQVHPCCYKWHCKCQNNVNVPFYGWVILHHITPSCVYHTSSFLLPL